MYEDTYVKMVSLYSFKRQEGPTSQAQIEQPLEQMAAQSQLGKMDLSLLIEKREVNINNTLHNR